MFKIFILSNLIMKNLIFIFILFQFSTIAQTLNKNYVFEELLRDPNRQPKVQGNFSALKTEEIRKSTLVETENSRRLFLGTGTHGYLWEVNITNSLNNNNFQPIINHGKVFSDKDANNKIRAIINDGRFIYGATSETPSLFFFHKDCLIEYLILNFQKTYCKRKYLGILFCCNL